MHSIRKEDDPRGNTLAPTSDNLPHGNVPLTNEDRLFGVPASAGSIERLVSCRDCGIPYSSLGLDLVLPDQQWNKIAPDCGVLCPNCICKRAEKFGGTVVLAWVDQIDYSISS